jgi:hypothetical protein
VRAWVRVGLRYDDFWRMSLRECDLILSETMARQKADFQEKRILQQEMAHLNMFAFNDPKNLPDFTKEKGTKPADKMSEAEADMRLRNFFVGQAVVSKGA